MKLYHGSNVAVELPRLLRSDRRLDFRPGFYCTSSYDQAARWAELTTRRRETGRPLVTSYDFDNAALVNLDVLEFAEADSSWLAYVAMHRNGHPLQDKPWDLVIGPMANDNTMPVLKLFFAGVYTEEETLRRLLPQKLKDQFAFRAQHAIDLLHTSEVIEL